MTYTERRRWGQPHAMAVLTGGSATTVVGPLIADLGALRTLHHNSTSQAVLSAVLGQSLTEVGLMAP